MSVEQKAPTVKEVFDCAHEIGSPDERQAYVERVCRKAPDVRVKVEALLKAYDEAGSILEPPTVGDAATGPYEPAAAASETPTAGTVHPSTESDTLTGVGPGSQIGPYLLIKPLGEGGMGAVYLAEQAQPVRRQVALKIIKPGMDSAQVVARFEAERQALALMEHPNIARVLDAGTIPTGQPFFVMELVQGVPMTRFCDKQKLTLRERLQLFIPVCQAIQHAHHKGIIHRDIKPSNILVSLVDGKPAPKVIDFGIAKAMLQPLTEQPAFTQMGAVLGTLEYMSPEQADGNPLAVDTRTDVYSLGVLLYELLTGVTPLDQGKLRKSGLVDALLMIINEEPPRPGTRLSGLGERQTAVATARQTEPVKLARALRGELDWIVMKALEKDRTRRYESASELAADVQRYLNDEPVLACPPTMRYRAGKFARKHWMGFSLAAGLLVLLLVGIVGLTAAVVLVTEQKNKTRDVATATQTALDDTTDDLINSFVGRRARLGPADRQFLRRLVEHYEQFAAVLGDTTEGREVAAKGHFRVAQLDSFLAEYPQAKANYLKARELFNALAVKFPAVPKYRDAEAKAANSLGYMLVLKTQEDEAAREPLQAALDLWTRLCSDFPDEPNYQYQRAIAQNNMGLALQHLRHPHEAEEAFRQTISWLRSLRAAFPSHPEYAESLADTLNNLATVLRDPNAAHQVYQECIETRTELVRHHPDEPSYKANLAVSERNFGLSLGNQPDAVAAYRRAVDIQRRLARDFPAVADYRLDLVNSLNDLGVLLRIRNKLPEAQKCFEQSIELAEQLAGAAPDQRKYSTDLGATYGNLANVLRDQHKPGDSLPWYTKGVKTLWAVVAAAPQDGFAREYLHNVYWDRANALGQLGQNTEAIKDWQEAIRLDNGQAKPSLERFLEAAELEKTLKAATVPLSAAVLYSHAVTFARASAAGHKVDEPTLQEQYAIRAVAMLKQAEARGYFREQSRIRKLDNDPAFASLRDRSDLRQLMAALTGKNASK